MVSYELTVVVTDDSDPVPLGLKLIEEMIENGDFPAGTNVKVTDIKRIESNAPTKGRKEK